jgi:hypothetical protein
MVNQRMREASTHIPAREAAHAATGAGPLLQRDYIGVMRSTACSPEELARLVREQFVQLAPPETAAFESERREGGPLEVGDELAIRIGGFLPCRVRVVQVDLLCLTLRTLCGHPEAGRISFRAGRDQKERLILHIRSRARSGGWLHYLGFLLLGRAMQGRCWIRFLGRAARACGGELDGPVVVKTTRSKLGAADCCGPDRSTFDCEG